MPKKKTSRSKPKVKGKATENICFTIMPFGDWFDSYYESIYVPAIEAAGLTPRRADDLYRPSAIVHDIWGLTQSAKLLLADLSGKNPNVFYELGLAHAIARPAILVAESIDDVPFDLRALRVLVYDKNEPSWGEVLRSNIESSIREVLAAPLEAVLPTFLKVKESSKASVTPAEKELISLRQDMDLLKRELSVRRDTYEPHRISASEARDRISTYIERGAPDELIIRRLTQMGAPSSWVRQQIRRHRTVATAPTTPQEVSTEADSKPEKV
jgi:hypothetical protein